MKRHLDLVWKVPVSILNQEVVYSACSVSVSNAEIATLVKLFNADFPTNIFREYSEFVWITLWTPFLWPGRRFKLSNSDISMPKHQIRDKIQPFLKGGDDQMSLKRRNRIWRFDCCSYTEVLSLRYLSEQWPVAMRGEVMWSEALTWGGRLWRATHHFLSCVLMPFVRAPVLRMKLQSHRNQHQVQHCASKSNISIIQRSQSKILRMIANAPWYVPNITLHEDLSVPLVKEVIKQRSTLYQNKIGHVNVLIQPLLQPHNQRRLKRNWPADLREG
jgi:hypothetical protein